MSALLLEPHQDDAVLFAAFTCIRHRPLVVTVFGQPVKQRREGIDAERRNRENAAALASLGCMKPEPLPLTDLDPSVPTITAELDVLPPLFDRVFAPAVEENGHPQHNLVGQLADDIFGPENVTHYLTYTNNRDRSTDGHEVEFEPAWVSLKLRALACFESQIGRVATVHHFVDGGLREWYQAGTGG